MPRPPIFERAMTDAERQRRHRGWKINLRKNKRKKMTIYRVINESSFAESHATSFTVAKEMAQRLAKIDKAHYRVEKVDIVYHTAQERQDEPRN